MPAALTRPRRFLPNGIVDAVVQLLVIALAYTLYQNTRGLIDDQLGASRAFANADWIVSTERLLHIDVERHVQQFAMSVPGLMRGSSLMYVNAQFSVTFGAMIYIYIRHNHAFGFVRNMFIGAWCLALLGYVLLPTAPPRLVPGLGIHDAVAAATGVDPADQTQAVNGLYNPYAAVPSMHVGFSLMIGVPLARLSKHRLTRIFWAIYPLLVLFVVMATGNHFLVDGILGAVAVGLAALVARWLGQRRPEAWSFGRRPATAADAAS
ncbi:phosphatase PAP2 family protein [Patulibacter sp. S7RM1-6]